VIRAGYPHVVYCRNGAVYRGLAFWPAYLGYRLMWHAEWGPPPAPRWHTVQTPGHIVVINETAPLETIRIQLSEIQATRQLPARVAL
jgi:hypothetical protein